MPMTDTNPAETHRVTFRKHPARTVALWDARCACGWESTGGLLRRADANAQADAHLAGTVR